jgi:hypothetical protein
MASAADADAGRHARCRRSLGVGPPAAAADQTFEQALRLAGNAAAPPRSYIYCQRSAPADVFRQFAERAQRESGWRCFEIDASHNPHITAPQALLDLLAQIASTAA